MGAWWTCTTTALLVWTACMTDLISEADSATEDLLRLYEELRVTAFLVQLVDGVVVVRCQNSEDVLPLCRKVVEAHEVPDMRTVN